MKIMTLNTHSLVEPDYESKLKLLAEVILAEQPDILAMQEVNQSADARLLGRVELPGYVRCGQCPRKIREDNHAARLAQLLMVGQSPYYWTWLPMKLGYDIYDEGLAVFSRRPIQETDAFRISTCDSYENWKTRWILGVRTDDPDAGWFYTVHMGWWKDEEEPFTGQWERLEDHLKAVKGGAAPVWLMGDFNSQADVPGEGYSLVAESGWLDTWKLARQKDSGLTVAKEIDGWRDQKTDGMRIDYIWCDRRLPIESSQVFCNGENHPVVSDHFGVAVQVEIPSMEP